MLWRRVDGLQVVFEKFDTVFFHTYLTKITVPHCRNSYSMSANSSLNCEYLSNHFTVFRDICKLLKEVSLSAV